MPLKAQGSRFGSTVFSKISLVKDNKQEDCEASAGLPGIYVHIPFCTRRCYYCNFATWGLKELPKRLSYAGYTDLLLREIELVLRNAEMRLDAPFSQTPRNADTLYFGGGTPSLLPLDELRKVVSKLKSEFELSKLKEFTLEANPETLTRENLEGWQDIGINRLSIGIQSLSDQALLNLGRVYTSKDVIQRLSDFMKELGHFQISFDLLLGIPWQDEEQVFRDIDELLRFNPVHFSLYGLKVEEGTPFEKLVNAKPKLAPSEDRIAEELTNAERLLTQYGYIRYEVSNFAKPESWSKHNVKYWRMAPFFGFGVSAAGFDRSVRTYNPRNFEDYAKSLLAGCPAFRADVLSEEDSLIEKLALGLRTIWGVKLSEFPTDFAETIRRRAMVLASEFPGLFSAYQNGAVSLTGAGMNVLHTIVSELAKYLYRSSK